MGWSLKLVCGDDFLARGEIENSGRLETERVIGEREDIGVGVFANVFSGNKDS